MTGCRNISSRTGKPRRRGQKPEWAAFTCENELAMEGHAIKERVVKRMSVLGEKLWGDGGSGVDRIGAAR